MATQPVASIVLPFRNSIRTLDRCLQSIVNQDCKEWELIAVNDHSSDGSEKIIEQYSKSDARILLLQTKGEGIVDALNYGISKSKSEIIVRMDSDDRMYPHRVHAQIKYLEANPKTGLIASLVCYKTEKKSNFFGKGYSLYVDWSNAIQRSDEIELHQFEECPLAHPSVAFRKSLLAMNGMYRKGDFPEDYELWLRWLSKGVKMEKLKICLLDWYDTENRLSRQGTNYSQEAFQKVKAKYFCLWLKKQKLGKRKLAVWGTGRIARRQIKYLLENKIQIHRYFEIDPRKIGNEFDGVPISSTDEITPAINEFIIVLTGKRGAKEQISEFLLEKKKEIGTDFIFLV